MATSDRRRPSSAVARKWQRWDLQELPDASSKRNQRPAPQAAGSQASALQEAGLLERLREEARQAAEREGYQAGFNKGRAEGYAEGLQAGTEAGRTEGQASAEATAQRAMDAQLQAALERLNPLLQQFDDALIQVQESMAGRLTELALALAGEIAPAALRLYPEQILDLVRELLHVEPVLADRPRLWLHPDDAALVRKHLGSELDAAGWQLQPDDQMHPGGARVTSRSGEIDARWEQRWHALCSEVERCLQRDHQEGNH